MKSLLQEIEEEAFGITNEKYGMSDGAPSYYAGLLDGARFALKRLLERAEEIIKDLEPAAQMNSDNELWIAGMKRLHDDLKYLIEQKEAKE